MGNDAIASQLLLLSLIPSTLVAYPFWTFAESSPMYHDALVHFTKNVCIIGALLHLLASATDSEPASPADALLDRTGRPRRRAGSNLAMPPADPAARAASAREPSPSPRAHTASTDAAKHGPDATGAARRVDGATGSDVPPVEDTAAGLPVEGHVGVGGRDVRADSVDELDDPRVLSAPAGAQDSSV